MQRAEAGGVSIEEAGGRQGKNDSGRPATIKGGGGERASRSKQSESGAMDDGRDLGDAEGVGQSSSGVRDGVQSSAVQCSEEAVEMSSKQNGVEPA
jgi:hypothetical protein